MAKHDFGIMPCPPKSGQRFDDYEPNRYSCISVDDGYIEVVAEACMVFDSFCHTLDIPMKGLNYCGVTLIPPCSLERFAQITAKHEGLSQLTDLLRTAMADNRFVIHYGL